MAPQSGADPCHGVFRGYWDVFDSPGWGVPGDGSPPPAAPPAWVRAWADNRRGAVPPAAAARAPPGQPQPRSPPDARWSWTLRSSETVQTQPVPREARPEVRLAPPPLSPYSDEARALACLTAAVAAAEDDAERCAAASVRAQARMRFSAAAEQQLRLSALARVDGWRSAVRQPPPGPVSRRFSPPRPSGVLAAAPTSPGAGKEQASPKGGKGGEKKGKTEEKEKKGKTEEKKDGKKDKDKKEAKKEKKDDKPKKDEGKKDKKEKKK
eukprot:TRINITY_DN19512_c0_g1_i1.p2 TRINITY_DN19512_c0_g1~~TRINITY_DN19512_c0_g1_i1.p2  ORF type:complete len:267 (+),score=81.07 TRINITY_DN19512_c0_g1_i1:84-884(+)